MKTFREFLDEKAKPGYLTKKDKTGHVHIVNVDDKGNGKAADCFPEACPKKHVHKVVEWNVQPAKGHTHKVDI